MKKTGSLGIGSWRMGELLPGVALIRAVNRAADSWMVGAGPFSVTKAPLIMLDVASANDFLRSRFGFKLECAQHQTPLKTATLFCGRNDDAVEAMVGVCRKVIDSRILSF